MVCSGLIRDHTEGGSTNLFPGSAQSVGEDAGEDESHGHEGIPNEKESGKLGQVYWTAVQLQCHEWVRAVL